MTKIKICGLRRKEDIEYVNECRPDYIGFVFANSKRKVNKKQAKELKKMLHPDIQSVGVFVNEEIATVTDVVKNGIIDIVQLHGDESSEYVKRLRECIPDVTIMKAIRVASEKDIHMCREIETDYLLLDSFSMSEYGGTGKAFDWHLINNIDKPYFLAGGINSSNVLTAVKMCHPYAIDISSAVETNGYKDRDKIIDIVNRVRSSEI